MPSTNQTMNPTKALKRVKKLIALACSTGPQGERESAALEAVEMIEKNGIVLSVTEKIDKDPLDMFKQWKADDTTPTPRNTWVAAKAPKDGFCTQCGGPVKKDDKIWFRPGAAVHDWPCWLG